MDEWIETPLDGGDWSRVMNALGIYARGKRYLGRGYWSLVIICDGRWGRVGCETEKIVGVQDEKAQFQVSEMRKRRGDLTLWGKFRIQRLNQKKQGSLVECVGGKYISSPSLSLLF